MADFAKLLSKNTSEIKRPALLPAGTYFGTIIGKNLGESKAKKTPFVEYPIQLTHAGEDVDKELLGDTDVSKKKITGISNRGTTFYLTDESEYRLKEFAASCSSGAAVENISLAELVEIPVGKSVMCSITQTPNQAGTEMYNECTLTKGA